MTVRTITRDEAYKLAQRLRLPPGRPLSFSQLDTYLKCPKSYYFQYVKQLPRIGWSENLVLGSAMHTGLEHVNRQRMGGSRKIHLGTARVSMRSSMDCSLENQEVSGMELEMLKGHLEKCDKLLKLWVTKHIAGYDIKGVEAEFFVLIAGMPMIVKIDLLTNNVGVADFKLSKNNKSQNDVSSSLQLGIYCLATNERQAGFITLKSPLKTSKKGWAPEINECFGIKKKYELEWSEEVVASVSKSIIGDNFPLCDPSSWKCSATYCDWHPICRGKSERQVRKPKFMSKMLDR